LELNTLKKLNGDKLGFPFLSIVLAKAMGLGATALCKYPCNCAGDSVCGSKLSMFFSFYKCNFFMFCLNIKIRSYHFFITFKPN